MSENCSVPFFQVAFILNWTSKALKSFSPVGMNLSSFLNAYKERRKVIDFIYNITDDVKNESGGWGHKEGTGERESGGERERERGGRERGGEKGREREREREETQREEQNILYTQFTYINTPAHMSTPHTIYTWVQYSVYTQIHYTQFTHEIKSSNSF